MSALTEVIAPRLETRFAGRGLRVDQGSPQSLVFPAAHAQVGDLVIYEDDGELTVIYGNFTHSHYGPFQHPPGTGLEQTIQDLVADLNDLFADRMVMWGSHDTTGGRFLLAHAEESQRPEPQYVWSGPRHGTEEAS